MPPTSTPRLPAHALPHTAAHNYRPDIDGLRAIAVLAVVGFHAFPQYMSGGFVGVDIFFVLSGFLITGIIAAAMAERRFSFRAFYVRRIRRIFPALLVVLITALLLGWVLLLPDEFRSLGKHVLGGALFSANFLLWQESGYFDAAADTKILLHLWSLAIEEQFYIVFPLLLWLAWKSRIGPLASCLLLAGLSFALNIHAIGTDTTALFYSPLTRAWELLAGAALALATAATADHSAMLRDGPLCAHPGAPGNGTDKIPMSTATDTRNAGWLHQLRERHATVLPNLVAVAGALVLTLGLLLITRERAFPGWWALLPVTGTLLLLCARDSWINRRLLSQRVLVWFGLISYPLYLWHWVLLTFLRIATNGNSTDQQKLLAIGTSILLAWLTVRLVERPLRFGGNASVKAGGLLASLVLVAAAGSVVHDRGGFDTRYVATHSTDMRSGWDGGNGNQARACTTPGMEGLRAFTCTEDSRGPARYALIGDSKALVLAPGVLRTAAQDGTWITVTSGGSILLPVLTDDPLYAFYPREPVAAAFAQIAALPDVETVVIASATRALFQLENDHSIADLPQSGNADSAYRGLLAAAEFVIASGKRVVLLVDNPTLPYPQDCAVRQTPLAVVNALITPPLADCNFSLDLYLRLREPYVDVLQRVAAQHPDTIRVFDATPLLCDSDRRICPFVVNGRILYGLTDHLSDHGAGLVGQALNRWLKAGQPETAPVR